jgi:hypothetical protein
MILAIISSFLFVLDLRAGLTVLTTLSLQFMELKSHGVSEKLPLTFNPRFFPYDPMVSENLSYDF